MGAKQSTDSVFNSKGLNGKAYVMPVVLPADKLHTSSSSSTLNSSSSDRSTRSSSSAASHDTDKEMLISLLQSYNYSAVLGKGSSAHVFKVVHKTTGEVFACKIVRKNQAMNDDRTMTTETEIMKRMEHENILRLHELFESDNSRWFVMELANAGSLQNALAAEEEYSEATVASAFKQVLEGAKYLHSKGIVHRDLKQDNILCSVEVQEDGTRNYSVKIADFGLSAVLDVKTSNKFQKAPKNLKSFRQLKDMWGTKEYFAPEVYEKAYGPQVDVWSLGCVLYELLVGETPFPVREKPTSAVERILLNGGHKIKRSFELRPGWQALSSEARDLISRMLKVNPRRRLSVAECLAHPWITGESLPAAMVSSPKSSLRGASFALASTVQAPVSHAESAADKMAEKRKVLTAARATAEKMVNQRARKLQMLAAQLEKERA